MSEKKYNSRSVDLVDALVRLHSNILLEPRLDVFEGFGVPWDLDCSIADPPSDEPERRRSVASAAKRRTRRWCRQRRRTACLWGMRTRRVMIRSVIPRRILRLRTPTTMPEL